MNGLAIASHPTGASGEQPPAPATRQSAGDSPAHPRALAPALLLVEDERDAREMLSIQLRRRGYRVDACGDGEAALAQLRTDHVAVIVDLVMPRVDGLTVLREMNARGSRAVRIVITSYADKDRAISALNLGARYLLEKPFGIDRLSVTLEEALASRPTSAAAESAALGPLLEERLAALGIGGRERTLVVLVIRGQSNAQIALRLGIKPQSVKSALFVLYRKLGVSSRGELFHLLFPV